MVEIALRAYLREIDAMTDGSRVDEAIAHLRHILTIYPKNLEAYRLLGKALLEKDRHLDAADIFQRVLSSVPDDFVSHVGMAIVREDEENIEAAIWHMERAYEAQPSNAAIQDELKRLYARRDGLEPPRLRLTRAALARLYEKGDLYPQAIAELRAALAEEPERIDLRVLMAQALWRARRRPEAAETSAKILEALPYCREANRIMADIWTESQRKAEAQIFRKRLESLDPYEAFANPSDNGSGAANVPENNVRIPRLEYTGQHELTATGPRPQWMESLGLEFEQPQSSAAASDVPDWLNAIETPAVSPFTSEALKEAGGSDWLSALPADAGSGAAAAPFTAVEAGELPDWMKEPSETNPNSTPTPSAEVGVPDWLKAAAGESAASPEPAAGKLPDWLKVNAEEQPQTSDPNAADSMMAAEWPPGDPSKPLVEAGTTAAADSVLHADAASDDTVPIDGLAPAQLPEWLKAQKPQEKPTPKARGDAPAWLREAMEQPKKPAADEPPLQHGWAARQTPPLEPLAADPRAAEDAPEWLKPILGSVEAGQTQAGSEQQKAASPLSEDDLPEWLKSASQSPDDTVAAFLKSRPTTSPFTPPRSAPSAAAAGPPQEPETPDWLAGLGQPQQPAPASTQPTTAKTETPSAASASPGSMSEDEALAWLESLAVKHGAKEEELVSKPEARKGDVPEWLRKPIADAEETAAEGAPQPEPGLSDWLGQKETETPRWLRQPQAETAVPSAAEEEDALPEGMSGAQGPAAAQAPAAALGEDELPEWLRDSAAAAPPSPQYAQPQPQAADDLPEWLHDARAVPPGAEPPRPTEAPAQPAEEQQGLDWIASFAEQRGEAAADSPRPAEEAQALPEWLHEAQAEKFTQPESAAAPHEAELPEWLQEARSAVAAAPERAPAEEEAAGMPSWSRGETQAAEDQIPIGASAEQQPAAGSMPPAAEEQEPSWLDELRAAQPEPIEAASKSAEAEELPEWLRDVQSLQRRPGASEASWIEPEAAEEFLKESAPQPPQTAEPGWIGPETVGDVLQETFPEPQAAEAMRYGAAYEEPPGPAPKAAKASKPRRASKSKRREPPENVLARARESLRKTNIGEAAGAYAQLIRSGESLAEVIADLEAANDDLPDTPELLRALGDAYMKDNQLQRALDTYKRALKQL